MPRLPIVRSFLLPLIAAFAIKVSATSELKATLQPSDIMQQVPPTAAGQVSFKNHRDYPHSSWAFRNMSAPLNGLILAREGKIQKIKGKHKPELAELEVETVSADKSKFADIFERSHTDGVLVLKDGKRVYEQYFNGMTAHDHHIWYSMTKSLVSAAAGILVEQGKVDLDKSPAVYIPELKGSGFERTTVRDVLNHASAITFKENYTDAESDFLRYYAPALNMGYIPGGRDAQPQSTEIYGVHDFIANFIKADPELEPGKIFDYNSSNADLLGWIIARVSGMPLREFLQKNLWAKLGTEHDGFIAVDRAYQAVATGGMNSTLRDAARFGLLALNHGKVKGEQVIPKSWLNDHLNLSEKDLAMYAANKKYANSDWIAYKNMWWVLDAEAGEFAAVGIHGQCIYINRKANVVAAFFSSQPVASQAAYTPFKDKLLALRAVAKAL